MRVLAIAVALTVMPAASVGDGRLSAEQIITRVATAHTQGWRDDGMTFDEQEAVYEAGGHLTATCGYVAELARRKLVEQGYTARRVAVLTRAPFDRSNDGHVMVEVRLGHGWVLFDPDFNRMAVDGHGRGVSFVRQVVAVRNGSARWKVIAHDRLLDLRGASNANARDARQAVAHLGQWTRRIMGDALIEQDGQWLFHSGNRQRIETYDRSYHWASADQWAALTR